MAIIYFLWQEEFYLFVCRFEAGLHETYEFEFNQLDTVGEAEDSENEYVGNVGWLY